MADTDRTDLLQGTLDMLVLKALQLEPMHGWGITERIEQWSRQVLQVNQGSLYPALYRLQRKGWITAAWKMRLVTADGLGSSLNRLAGESEISCCSTSPANA